MPTTPRLLTDETCEPARLTSAEVISSPEVRSAFSIERAIDWEAACQINDGAFADALGGLDAHTQDAQAAFFFHARNQGADLGCADINSNYNWFVHVGLQLSIKRCIDEFDADHVLRKGALLFQMRDDGSVHGQLEIKICQISTNIDIPTTRIFPT